MTRNDRRGGRPPSNGSSDGAGRRPSNGAGAGRKPSNGTGSGLSRRPSSGPAKRAGEGASNAPSRAPNRFLDSRPGSRPGAPRIATESRPQRFEKPPLSPQVTTLWDYPSQHYGDEEQGSKSYVGATPSYVIWNVINRYTGPDAVVLDPFCGSGTTLDVCKDLGRQGIGFDLAPYRPDIGQADARSLPVKSKTVDLVFMDPPYADNLTYSDDARCIGKLPGDGRYQRAMRLVIAETTRVLKPDGVLAIYVCDVLKKGRIFQPLGFELFAMTDADYFPIDVVSVVRHNRTLEMGNYRKAADEQGFFLRGFNYLMLFRRRSARE